MLCLISCGHAAVSKSRVLFLKKNFLIRCGRDQIHDETFASGEVLVDQLFEGRSVRLPNQNVAQRRGALTVPLLFCLRPPPRAFLHAQCVEDLGEGCESAIDHPPALVVNVLFGGLLVAVEPSGKDGVSVKGRR